MYCVILTSLFYFTFDPKKNSFPCTVLCIQPEIYQRFCNSKAYRVHPVNNKTLQKVKWFKKQKHRSTFDSIDLSKWKKNYVNVKIMFKIPSAIVVLRMHVNLSLTISKNCSCSSQASILLLLYFLLDNLQKGNYHVKLYSWQILILALFISRTTEKTIQVD